MPSSDCTWSMVISSAAKAGGRRSRREPQGERDRGERADEPHRIAPWVAKTTGSTWTPWSARRSRKRGRSPVETQVALELALVVHPGGVVEQEDVLGGDDVALHADDLGDRGDPAGAVLETGLLDDEVDGAGDLLADGAHGKVHAGHQDHRLETRERVARGVGVERRDRAVVAGVHRLEHVEGGRVADLADDDAVRAHTQGVLRRGRGW